MRLSVLTWNIHKGIGGLDRRYRPERIVDLLRGQDPDVVLLQEVALDWPRCHFHDQMKLLREALGMSHAAFAPEHRYAVGGYGNAVLSRWPILESQRLNLTIGSRKRRGVLRVRCRVRFRDHSRSVVFYNLHLGLGGAERVKQLRRFLAAQPLSGLSPKTPVILGGDFNDVWGGLGPRLLLPAGFRRVGTRANTFPAWLPMRPLDGLYIRGDLDVVRCAPVRGKRTRHASDHLPVTAELRIRWLHAGTRR